MPLTGVAGDTVVTSIGNVLPTLIRFKVATAGSGLGVFSVNLRAK